MGDGIWFRDPAHLGGGWGWRRQLCPWSPSVLPSRVPWERIKRPAPEPQQLNFITDLRFHAYVFLKSQAKSGEWIRHLGWGGSRINVETGLVQCPRQARGRRTLGDYGWVRTQNSKDQQSGWVWQKWRARSRDGGGEHLGSGSYWRVANSRVFSNQQVLYRLEKGKQKKHIYLRLWTTLGNTWKNPENWQGTVVTSAEPDIGGGSREAARTSGKVWELGTLFLLRKKNQGHQEKELEWKKC